MEKLPEYFKTKWVAALRSGEYEQGESYLEWDDKFCCLGVLCKVNGVPTLKLEDDIDIPMEFIPSTAKKVIPEFLLGSGEFPELLAKMNDGNKANNVKKHSFLEIADYIEQNL